MDELTKSIADICLKNGPYPYETECQRRNSVCRFCGDKAVSIYYFDEGCQGNPDWKIQALCLQHENKSQPINNIELIWKING